MTQCKDCKHWNRPAPDDWPAPFGHCEQGSSVDGEPVYTQTLAYGHDSEWYKARLVTHPEFGCVMAQSKPQESNPQLAPAA